jgi:Fe-S-cluster containining protein
MKTNLPAIARETKRIYFDTDVRMKSIPKVCAEGCSFCCHQNVRVHFGEGPAIENFINEEMSSQNKALVKQNLISWFNYFDENTPNRGGLTEADILRFEIQITIDRIPCAFLVNERFSIYKARPLVCRTHSVNDSSELCNQNPHRNGDSTGIEIQRQKFGEISKASDMFGIRLLAYVVQDVLGLNRNCKPVGLDVSPTLRPIV